MPEDRFEDLGRAERGAGDVPGHGELRRPDGSGRRTAAERLAELDVEPDPRSESRRPDPQRPRGRYLWVVGVAAILALIVLGVYQIRAADDGSLRGIPPGEPLPAFAAPSATGRLDGDANVSQGTSDPPNAGRRPACEVKGRDVVNVCELRTRPLVLSFIVTRGTDCEPQLDRFDALAAEYPDVNFAAVVSGEQRDEVARLARERGWDFPVAVDPDGAVVNLYRVGVCPTTLFALPGGEVRDTRLGILDDRELRARVTELQRAASERARQDARRRHLAEP